MKKTICAIVFLATVFVIFAKSKNHIHTWDDGKITRQPTCAEYGEKIFKCKKCKETKVETISKEEHSWDKGVVVKESTCSEWGEKKFTCKDCKETKIDLLSKKPHTWDSGIIAKEPTCGEYGQKLFNCIKCNEKKTEQIAMLEHPFSSSFAFDETYHWHKPTCEHYNATSGMAQHSWDEGNTVNKVTIYTCTVCGETKSNYRELDKIGKLKFIQEPNNPSLKGGVYVQFGTWPQSIKKESVTIDESVSITQGANTYYAGSDGEWYEKCVENVNTNRATYAGQEYEQPAMRTAEHFKYSDGTKIKRLSDNGTRYFKVEPIVWRVITENYSGKVLLLSENILASNVPYYAGDVKTRIIEGKKYFEPSYKYSNVRAWLNGINNQFVTDGGKATEYDLDWTGKGFFQTAFTPNQQNIIATAIVDNGEESTCDENGIIRPGQKFECSFKKNNDYDMLYTYDEMTEEKVFLLSEREVTSSEYGFNMINYNGRQHDNKTTKKPTDYAKANYCGVPQWILRSSRYYIANGWNGGEVKGFAVQAVNEYGNADGMPDISNEGVGIVPALTMDIADMHSFSEKWQNDDDFHWHESICEHKGEIYKKNEHSWDAGKITIGENSVGNCTKVFTCTVCGKTKETLFATKGIDLKNLGTYKTIAEPKGASLIGGNYVSFGVWPQTIKSKDVFVDENVSEKIGGNTYYLGSDGEWYAKCVENSCNGNHRDNYSDGTVVNRKVDNTNKYFKVEPIVWRLLTDNYSGKKLLLSEKILMADIQYYGIAEQGFRRKSEKRSFSIESNDYEYSNIRAWLNGKNNQFVTDGGKAGKFDVDWTDKGFLQTAFTAEQQKMIPTITVDNYNSSFDGRHNSNSYNTKDKVFLLSESEVRRGEYGFADDWKYDIVRKKTPTDYALANYSSNYYWRLRTSLSSYRSKYYIARCVGWNGFVDDEIEHESSFSVAARDLGIAPALCVE